VAAVNVAIGGNGFDIDLRAKVSDDNSGKLFAEFTVLKVVLGAACSLVSTSHSLLLNFFDSPALAAIEFSFAHESLFGGFGHSVHFVEA
jgi:hypothetical protein